METRTRQIRTSAPSGRSTELPEQDSVAIWVREEISGRSAKTKFGGTRYCPSLSVFLSRPSCLIISYAFLGSSHPKKIQYWRLSQSVCRNVKKLSLLTSISALPLRLRALYALRIESRYMCRDLTGIWNNSRCRPREISESSHSSLLSPSCRLHLLPNRLQSAKRPRTRPHCHSTRVSSTPRMSNDSQMRTLHRNLTSTPSSVNCSIKTFSGRLGKRSRSSSVSPRKRPTSVSEPAQCHLFLHLC